MQHHHKKKKTGNLENFFRIYASHKAPLLTLTDCLSLFSILPPRAPDAGMKSPVLWDKKSWRLLTRSQPKGGREAVPPGSGGTQRPLMPALHWAPSGGSFLQVCTPFLLQLELPDVHKATSTWDLCWLLWALGGKQGGHSTRCLWKHNALVSTSIPNTAWHFPQEQMPDGCWSELVSPKSGTRRDIPNQLQHTFSCGYSSF